MPARDRDGGFVQKLERIMHRLTFQYHFAVLGRGVSGLFFKDTVEVVEVTFKLSFNHAAGKFPGIIVIEFF